MVGGSASVPEVPGVMEEGGGGGGGGGWGGRPSPALNGIRGASRDVYATLNVFSFCLPAQNLQCVVVLLGV